VGLFICTKFAQSKFLLIFFPETAKIKNPQDFWNSAALKEIVSELQKIFSRTKTSLHKICRDFIVYCMEANV